jgi:GNAT superfamily N-acetyltransferase
MNGDSVRRKEMILRSRRKIDGYRQEIILNCGDKIILRPVGPQDKEALRSFFNRLSEDTRFLRYQYHKNEMSEQELNDFCAIDYDNSMALVAEKGMYGQRCIIGVGGYYRLNNDHTAEVAFVVQDDEQRKGIGTQLLKHLAFHARSNDIEYFVGEVLRENGKMLSIFRKADPGMENKIADGSSCTVSLSVPEVIHNSLILSPQ